MLTIKESVETIIQTIIGGALTIASIYLPIFMAKAVEMAKSKTLLIKNEETKKVISNAINRIDDLITTNIIAVENTLKPKILEAIKDGKVDKKELNELSVIVKQNVLKQINTDTSEILNAVLSDTNSYLENRIEKILAELKNAEGSVVSYTAL